VIEMDDRRWALPAAPLARRALTTQTPHQRRHVRIAMRPARHGYSIALGHRQNPIANLRDNRVLRAGTQALNYPNSFLVSHGFACRDVTGHQTYLLLGPLWVPLHVVISTNNMEGIQNL
jgi:hypothetical protein